MSAQDENTQVDMALLDFSKAFDTIPHQRLLRKLEQYGTNGQIQTWIHGFLTTWEYVVVDGKVQVG